MLLATLPIRLEFFVFVALVPWLWSLRSTDRRGAWKSGYVLGFFLGLGQLYMLGVLTYRWTGSWVLMVVPWIVSALLFALYFGWAGIQIWKCWQRGAVWMIPFSWVGIEIFRSYIPVFAFPYALTAVPLWKDPALIQIAHFGMIFLVSFWIVLGNVILALLISKQSKIQIKPLAILFVALLGLNLLRYSEPLTGSSLKVAALQPGVDMAFGRHETEFSRLRRAIQPLIDRATADGAQLLVLPEGISDAHMMPPVTPFVPSDVPIVFGGRRGIEPVYQSAFGFDGTYKWADKSRLVVFGEFVPGRSAFPFIAKAFSLPSGDMSAGPKGTEAFDLGGTRIGPVICFEGLFPDIAYRQALNGAQILTVISIDDWYMGTPAPDQLRAASAFRAVETGLPLVRAASLGYSMVIDAKGRVVSEVPIGDSASASAEVQVPGRGQGTLPILPVFPLSCVILMFGFGFLPRKKVAVDSLPA